MKVRRITKKKWVKWTLVLLWCGLIFYATQSPNFTGDNTAKIIKKITEKDQNTVENETSIENKVGLSLNKLVRKGAHLSVFGALAILIVIALSNIRYRYSIAWFLATLYGVFDELHQSITPGRTASIIDVGYDSLGAILALLLYSFYVKRKKQTN
jgi:VanZ family protein